MTSSQQPGPPVYQPAQYYGLKLRALEPLAMVAKVLVFVSTALAGVAALTDIYLVLIFNRIPSAFEWSLYEASGVLILLDLLVYAVAGVAVVVLLYQMAANGAAIVPLAARHKSHWAITSWFIPFLNFVRPYSMVKQIWETSRTNQPNDHYETIPGYFKLWWGLFLATTLGGPIAPTVPADGPVSMNDFANEAIGQLILNLLTVGAGVTFLLVLRALVRRQEQAIVDPWTVGKRPSPEAPAFYSYPTPER